MIKKTKLETYFFLILSLLIFTSCIKNFENKGYVFDNNFVSKIKIGKTSSKEVLDNMGDPSTKSFLKKETWFYISSKRESISFFSQKVTAQSIIRIEFEGEKVSGLEKYYLKDINKLSLNKDSSIDNVNDTGILKQLIGNIGKYSTNSKIE